MVNLFTCVPFDELVMLKLCLLKTRKMEDGSFIMVMAKTVNLTDTDHGT